MGLKSLLIKTIECLYLPPLRRIVSLEIFRYGVCGATTATLDALWYFVIYNFIVAKRFLNLGFVVVSPHILSLALVFPVTLFTGFWLNRNIAFRTTHISGKVQLLKYLLSIVGSVALNYISMKLLVEHLGLWPTPAKVTTTAVTALYSYLAGRYFVFR